MRRVVCFAALGLAACGQAPQRSEAPSPSMRAPRYEGGNATAPAAESRQAGPDVSPTAAPGVAFNYRYSFRLPAERIAAVQERHAATCEALGVRRCRITGMLYRVVGENDVEAMLSFQLDPAIARRFGRAGVEAVTQAEGMLTESLITGEDVGVQRTSRDLAQMREELRGLEAQLGRGDLPPDERARIEAEMRDLRAQIDNAQNVRADQEEMLATTPMTFNYGSGQFAPGEQRPSLSVALDRAVNGFLYGGTLLLVILITLLPWVAAGLIVWALVAFVRRRWFRRPTPATDGGEPPASTPASLA
ncbi:hypothetical protein [Sphingosinicella sp.]|uniref:hypothetical protein n=1 Tax=Sphingosinicella sp. TaxID=1917971 RepID=UPI004037D4B7